MNFKPDNPPGKPPGNVFERANSPPPGTKKGAEKWCYGPIPGAIIFEKLAKRHKTLVKNYENSTELLIFVELLTYKSLKLLHGWLLWSSNFSPFIYKPTQKIDAKQVPKYDFH